MVRLFADFEEKHSPNGNIFAKTAHEPRERLGGMAKASELGVKSSSGFFNYQNLSSGKGQIKERDRILISLLKLRSGTCLGGEMGTRL